MYVYDKPHASRTQGTEKGNNNMVLGFKRRFPVHILAGTKIHTIRADPHNRWKAGISIQMATGVRTKKYHQFNKGIPGLNKCISTQKIIIEHDVFAIGDCLIFIDDKQLTTEQIILLSKNDGFETLKDFYLWFNTDFIGKIIHWTKFKY
jgi:hypothetical protein